MIVSHNIRSSGLLVVLIAYWSSPVLGNDEYGRPALLDSRLAPASQYGAIAPVPAVLPVCRCTRSRGLFDWFRRRPAACPTDGCDLLCSGCNVHPDPPFGASYHATMQAQVARGEAALMVLHQFDFLPGEPTLNHRGRLRLQKIAHLLPQNPFPVVIESSRDNRALDEARQAGVFSELASRPFPVPAERVVIGPSPTRGLDGLDAEVIHKNLLILSGAAVPSPR